MHIVYSVGMFDIWLGDLKIPAKGLVTEKIRELRKGAVEETKALGFQILGCR